MIYIDDDLKRSSHTELSGFIPDFWQRSFELSRMHYTFADIQILNDTYISMVL
jgi:hypothetical protein